MTRRFCALRRLNATQICAVRFAHNAARVENSLMDIGQKIRDARKAKGLTLEALAHQVGTDTGNLSRLERGKQGASQELLRKIMGELEMTVSHVVPSHRLNLPAFDNLIAVTAEENRMLRSELKLPHSAGRKFPVVTWHEAYQWAADPSSMFFDEGSEEYPSTAAYVDEAVWVKVVGDAMATTTCPSFPEGSLILILRNVDLISGKYYAFSIGESGDFTFKQYIEDAGYKYLKPLNNSYKTIEMRPEHILIGRIVDVKMTGL